MCKCKENLIRKYLLYIFISLITLSFGNSFCMDYYNENELAIMEKNVDENKLDLSRKSTKELEKILNSITIQDLNTKFFLLFTSAESALDYKNTIQKSTPPKKEVFEPKKDAFEPKKGTFENISINNNLNYKYFENLIKNVTINIPVQNIKIANQSYMKYKNPNQVVEIYFDKKFLDKKTEKDINIILEQINNFRTDCMLKTEEYHCSKRNIERSTKETIKESIENIIKLTNPETALFSECFCIPKLNRIQFEADIIKKIKNTKDINYLSFASGDLLPDLKILTDLIKNGKKIKNIHIIDNIYKSLIITLKEISKTKEKMLNTNTAFLDEIIVKIQNINLYLKVLISDYKQTIQEKEDIEALLRIIMLLQFIKILSELQGEPIPLYIYSNLDSYIKVSKENNIEKINLATIIDLPDFQLTKDLKQKILNNMKSDGVLGICTKNENTFDIKK